MESIVRSNHHFRFRAFSLDPQTRELFRNGIKQRIYGQPLEVLAILIAHPGELVTREALQKALWPEDTFVDFENSLNNNVKRLREALGDDPGSPRFIETVPRLGYRFIAPVERPEPESVAPPPAPAETSQSAAPTAAKGSTPIARRRRIWPWIAASSATVAVVLGLGLLYLGRPLPPPRITSYIQITHDGHRKDLVGTDGNRLYFTEWAPNLIGQAGVNGGEIAHFPIVLPGRAMELEDISPDGSNALISDGEEGHTSDALWVVPLLGGAAKRLEYGEDGPAFTPDGGSVVYSTSSGDIFMAGIDGSGKHKLANVGSRAYWFRWSADGKVVRFSKQDGLWEMSANGTGIHRLLPNWKEGVPGWGKWTRDGSFFVFEADDQIWALDERRGLFRKPPAAPILLTSGPMHWQRPIPAKDGNGLIFAAGSKMRGELTRIDPKTGAPQPFLDGISAEYVSFSPDGNYVAYVAFPEGTLWRANRDGSNRMQLTRRPDYVFNPRWSPDSKEILFTSETSDYRFSIHRISASDGASRWLPSEDSVDMSDPNWSPDGTKVVFQRGSIATTEKKVDLRIIDLKTRQATVVPGSEGKWSPRWSPNGRYIAALVYPQVNHLPLFDLKLLRWFDNSVNGEAGFPAFSRDSRYIYFTRTGPDEGVFRVPVTGGKEERVVDMTGWHQTGHWTAFMSLDPTDAPLILRDASSDDIYALTLERK